MRRAGFRIQLLKKKYYTEPAIDNKKTIINHANHLRNPANTAEKISQGLARHRSRRIHRLKSYAVTKVVNEMYADDFAKAYTFQTTGLRYFNIFGQRKDSNGAYAAVISKWFVGFINCETTFIDGDGETSRDFCYIGNCIQANLLATTVDDR